MPKYLSSYLLICQDLIQDKDHLYTAVKIADIFLVDPPSTDGGKVARMVSFKFLGCIMGLETGDHKIRITLTGPSGKTDEVMKESAFPVGQRFAEAPGGYTCEGAMNLIPRDMGTHVVRLIVDDEVCATAVFTFLNSESVK